MNSYPEGASGRWFAGSRSFTTYAAHHGPIVREEGGRRIGFALMNRPLAALEQSFLRTKSRDLACRNRPRGGSLAGEFWRLAGRVGRSQPLPAPRRAINPGYDDALPSTPVPFTASMWGSLAAFGGAPHPGVKRFYGERGNSFVAAVEFEPRVRAVAVSAGGERGDPASPHFADQIGRYAAGDLRPVHFFPDELSPHVTATRVLYRR